MRENFPYVGNAKCKISNSKLWIFPIYFGKILHLAFPLRFVPLFRPRTVRSVFEASEGIFQPV